MAKDADVGPAQKRVVYQLQLLGCTFRRALRKQGKRIIVALSSASEGLPSAEDERAAAAGICNLLETADAAMCTIQKVQSLLLCLCDPHQVQGPCEMHTSAIDKAALPTRSHNSQHSVQSIKAALMVPGLQRLPGRWQSQVAAGGLAAGGGADAAGSPHHPAQAGLQAG